MSRRKQARPQHYATSEEELDDEPELGELILFSVKFGLMMAHHTKKNHPFPPLFFSPPER